MKKIIAVFLLLSVLCIQNAAAKPVKEDEAKQFAKNYKLGICVHVNIKNQKEDQL